MTTPRKKSTTRRTRKVEAPVADVTGKLDPSTLMVGLYHQPVELASYPTDVGGRIFLITSFIEINFFSARPQAPRIELVPAYLTEARIRQILDTSVPYDYRMAGTAQTLRSAIRTLAAAGSLEIPRDSVHLDGVSDTELQQLDQALLLALLKLDMAQEAHVLHAVFRDLLGAQSLGSPTSGMVHPNFPAVAVGGPGAPAPEWLTGSYERAVPTSLGGEPKLFSVDRNASDTPTPAAGDNRPCPGDHRQAPLPSSLYTYKRPGIGDPVDTE